MLTKEICAQALNDMKMYGGINIPPLAFDIIDRLIEEHFTPQPLRFEDLKEGMYVYDKKMNNIVKVERSYINYARELIVAVKTFNYGDADMYYEDNRFYPIAIPNVGDKNEKHI
ncbi:MAG: hypothetical protein Q4Q31_10510 [Bacillota bacterium]|nr:hypothetical protein [Bacillota bacterium]